MSHNNPLEDTNIISSLSVSLFHQEGLEFFFEARKIISINGEIKSLGIRRPIKR